MSIDDDAMPLSGFFGPEDWMPVPAADSATFLDGDEPTYEDELEDGDGRSTKYDQEATNG